MEDKVLFNNIQYVSRVVALVSFLIGTVFLLLFKLAHIEELVMYGLYYVLVAFVINFIVLLILLIMFVHRHVDHKENLISIGAVLANIPVALVYLSIVFSSF